MQSSAQKVKAAPVKNVTLEPYLPFLWDSFEPHHYQCRYVTQLGFGDCEFTPAAEFKIIMLGRQARILVK
jgi:hypothetical protein